MVYRRNSTIRRDRAAVTAAARAEARDDGVRLLDEEDLRIAQHDGDAFEQEARRLTTEVGS